MNWTVVQVRKPIDEKKNATEPCFIMHGPQVWTVLEARKMIHVFELTGASRDWFIIIQTYPV